MGIYPRENLPDSIPKQPAGQRMDDRGVGNYGKQLDDIRNCNRGRRASLFPRRAAKLGGFTNVSRKGNCDRSYLPVTRAPPTIRAGIGEGLISGSDEPRTMANARALRVGDLPAERVHRRRANN